MSYNLKSFTLFSLASLAGSLNLGAEVHLASPFGSHMVLQQQKPVPVWGKAAPGEKVTVRFASQEQSVVAAANGSWSLRLSALEASAEPRIFEVTGSETSAPLVLEDVLVGEVWLCGGQSNMERQLGPRPGQKPIIGWAAEVASANRPLLRQLYVEQTRSTQPQDSVTATWSVCSPETATEFTAVGYFMGRDLQDYTGVPVGLIHASWGGTPAEAWTSADGLNSLPEYAELLKAVEQASGDPETVAREYSVLLDKWYAGVDTGSRDLLWSKPAFDDSSWKTMKLPVMWEDAGMPGFDGIGWYRKTVSLPEAWAGKDLVLELSAVDDRDTTWVNGVLLGSTDGWMTPRSYHIPASVLHAGSNLIAVRVLDTGGGGGIWNADMPLRMYPVGAESSALSLCGEWRCAFPVSLKDVPQPPPNVLQGPGVPTVLFNGMIAPIVPYALRGVAFYQGEANAGTPMLYRRLFPAMIADWRRLWGQGDFPFLYVQIAPFKSMPPEIRQAQLVALKNTENTAMVVTTDVGDADDIHPADKEPVGERLALAARVLAYGERAEYSGPIFEKVVLEGASARVQFSHVAKGLVAPGGTLQGFEVCGADGVYYPASASINGDGVVVSSPAVNAVVAVRYAWADVASGNLYNTSGLPASPFQSDAF